MIFKKNISPASDQTPFKRAWNRFRQNKFALLSLCLLMLLVITAILGYTLATDKTSDCNTIIPEIALLRSGSHATLLKIPSKENSASGFFVTMLWGDKSSSKFLPIRKYEFKDTALLVTLIKGVGLNDEEKSFSYSLFTQENKIDRKSIIQKHFILERTFFLGTDNLGRDIFSRLLLGLRISLAVGLIAVLISLLIGITLGSIAGYNGGKTDSIILWIMNVIWAIPTVLLVFAITILLGKGFWQIFIAVGLTTWVGAARIIRGQVMQVKQMEFIEAARSLGYRTSRIIMVHILPTILGPVMVIAASNFATAILLEAGLSFLGIGVQAPTPSWGSMIKDNYGYIISDNPMMALIPGLAIMTLVLLLNLVGNGLRDALDVKTKNI